MLEVIIDANPGDVKRIIGTKGAHIGALRRWVRLWAETHDCSATVRDFAVPKDNRDRYGDFQQRPDWPKERLSLIIEGMASAVLHGPVKIECADQDDVTHMVVRHHAGEDTRIISGLSVCLPILGTAMGKKNGHTLSVHVRPYTAREKSIAVSAINK